MNATTKQFDYDAASRLFTSEMSILSNGGRLPVFKQIYPDAVDQGLTLVSHRTGREVDYVVVKVDMAGCPEDFEIAGWRLEPTAQSVRKEPACRGTQLLIIND